MNYFYMRLNEISFFVMNFLNCAVSWCSDNMLHFHSLHSKYCISFLQFGTLLYKDFWYGSRHRCNCFLCTSLFSLWLFSMIRFKLESNRISFWIKEMDIIILLEILDLTYLTIYNNVQLVFTSWVIFEVILLISNFDTSSISVFKLSWNISMLLSFYISLTYWYIMSMWWARYISKVSKLTWERTYCIIFMISSNNCTNDIERVTWGLFF